MCGRASSHETLHDLSGSSTGPSKKRASLEGGQLTHDREKQLKNCWPFNLVPIVQPHVLGKRHIQPPKPEHLASVLIHCLDRLKVPLYARDVPTSRQAAR